MGQFDFDRFWVFASSQIPNPAIKAKKSVMKRLSGKDAGVPNGSPSSAIFEPIRSRIPNIPTPTPTKPMTVVRRPPIRVRVDIQFTMSLFAISSDVAVA